MKKIFIGFIMPYILDILITIIINQLKDLIDITLNFYCLILNHPNYYIVI